ncbi:MAG: dockerin type I repeat-containing protein [Clostridia bacterium]|nr:dockerin type I repeat-containing protein [Clostridia bacterium]
MKTAKRILAISLSIILAIAVFAFPASAVEGTMTFSLTTDQNTYAPGDTVTVSVSVSSTYKATCMRIPILFSSDVFEVVEGSGVRLTAYGSCLESKGALDYNTDTSDTPIDLMNVTDYYDSGSYGIIAIQWVANITAAGIGSFYSADSVKCFSFQLKVKSGASGEGTILIPAAEELKPAFAFYNQTVLDPADATTICRVNATFNVDEWSVSIAGGEEDGITTFPDSDVIIDYDEHIIKNWEDGMDKAMIETNVMPTGNATLQFVPSEKSGEYGTGSSVKVWVGTDLIDEYVNLLYGDVNGDGVISASDMMALSRFVSGLADIEEEIFILAGDVNASCEITVSDVMNISRYISGLTDISQAI